MDGEKKSILCSFRLRPSVKALLLRLSREQRRSMTGYLEDMIEKDAARKDRRK